MKLKDKKMTDKLTALRVEFGLTQAELARAVGVSRQTVSRWERGFIVPSTANLISLGCLYGLPLDELMNEEPDGEEEPAAPEALKAPETEAAEMEEPDGEKKPAAPEALKAPEAETAEMEELDATPVPRRPVFRRVWAAALAGCILLTGISTGIAIGVTVLKEPEKPSDSLVIISQDDLEWEDIDLTEVINMSEEDSGIIFTKSDKE